MKNNRSTIYFLFPLVLIIWGVIFYKVFYKNNREIFENQAKQIRLIDKDSVSVVDFRLNLDYEDPFLKKIRIQKKAQAEKTVLQPMAPEEVLMWPGIIYNGFIKNEKGGLVYLDINGKIVLVGLNEETNDIVVLNYAADSVLIRFKRENKWIKKN